jgi:DMSO/TMAO reductase YedYZ heme-binding membrane subunit
MLLVLLTTITTALLLRRTHPAVWSRLHVLNYTVFTVGLIHAMGIGTQGSARSGRILLAVYLAIGLSGLAYRASSSAWRQKFVPSPARVRNRGV